MPDIDKHMMQSPDDFETAVLWGIYFEKTGCVACGSKTNTHSGWGFCLPCAEKKLKSQDYILHARGKV